MLKLFKEKIVNFWIPPSPKSKRDEFLELYYPYQSFSLPKPIMRYIAEMPSNPKGYQKLVQTCKNFFIKNPIIVAEELCITKNFTSVCLIINCPQFYLTGQIQSRFWITQEIRILSHPTKTQNWQIPNFYRIDAKRAEFNSIAIPFNLFVSTLLNVEILVLSCKAVKKVTMDLNLPEQKNIEKFLKYNGLSVSDIHPMSKITPNSIKKLLELPGFSKIRLFRITNIPDTFDIETFFTDIIKKNMQTKFCFIFCDSISDEYKNRLEIIIKEILSTQKRKFRLPLIEFDGQDRKNHWAMHSLFCYD